MNRLAVIGNPVAHSRSPDIHAAFGQQTGIALSYEKVLAPLDRFVGVARDLARGGFRGFNVTLPFKHEAFLLVDRVSASAAASEAVNTVTISAAGELSGDNTDGAGLVTDLTQNLGWEIKGARILLLGAGGAVSGILPALQAERPASIDVMNRTRSKAEALANRFGIQVVDDPGQAYDLVISGSSAGLAGAAVDLPLATISDATCCYDMIYGPGTTPFLSWAAAAGCVQTSDGLGMLVEQAALAFNCWFDVMPRTEPVIAGLRRTIGG
ncbi:MAG: shikimate dehydrogenase [Pseudomonadota bacterium]